ncbi:hypothetical protein EV356DRAFT_572095 [Viridothelium virens]|uniref:Uncharacterized protein n=1 Tax=Viridothelium virens TaxID=1048519 RepID=A0A6A6HQF9_VIRVR|nr:hypothetical protein EV356DRAFT_572095 [Viridothelium virens]
MKIQDLEDTPIWKRTQISFALPSQPTAVTLNPGPASSGGDGSDQLVASTTTMLKTETMWMTTTAIAWQTPPATTVFVQKYPSGFSTVMSSTFADQMQPTDRPSPPQGGMPPPDQHRNKNSLSDGAEDLIIAFTSVGGTLLFLFLIYAFYQTRRGVPFNELLNFKHAIRRRKIKEAALPISSSPPSRPDTANSCNAQNTFATATAEKVDARKGPQKPRMVMIRTTSDTSANLNPSHDTFPEKPAFAPLAQGPQDTASNPTSKPANWPLRSIRNSRASSAILPSAAADAAAQDPSRSESRSTRNRTITPSAFETYPIHAPTPERQPPTGPNLSRFSWTEAASQEPPTPRFALGLAERQSVATSARSSLPRFRKVESWVGNQVVRLDSVLFRNQPGVQNGGGEGAGEVAVPVVPQQGKVWKGVVKGAEGEDREEQRALVRVQEEMEAGHARQVSDATVFRQHPGTMLSPPRASVIRSEDLDQRLRWPGLI